jgi:hypothetical protein
MFNRLRERLTYANVIATIALFAAIVGGAALVSAKGGGGGKKLSMSSEQMKPSGSGIDADSARADAKKVTLFKKGPVTIYGKCYEDTTADEITAGAFAKTKKNHVLFSAYEGDELVGDPYLDENTSEGQREAGSQTASSNTVEGEDHDNLILWMVPGEAGYHRANVTTIAKNDNPDSGGPFKNGDRCLFLSAVFK